MQPVVDEILKHREIEFQSPHPEPNQATAAANLLAQLPCVTHCGALSENRLTVDYDVREITLRDILDVLEEAGFHIEGGLLNRMLFALYEYAEETQRENMGCSRQSGQCAREMFMRCYEKRRHGCRDPLTGAWREYQ